MYSNLSEQINQAVNHERIPHIISSIVKPPEPEANFVAPAVVGASHVTRAPSSGIPSQPLRLLDMPNIPDDFYTTTLSWSTAGLVAVYLGRAVTVWDARTGNVSELFTMDASAGDVTALQWAQDPRFLAVGSSDGTIWVIDVSTTPATTVRALRAAHASAVYSFDWSGPLLASAGADGLVRVWDVRAASAHLATLPGHASAVVRVRWSPDGGQLVSGGADNVVCLWSRADIDAIAQGLAAPTPGRLLGHTAAVRGLAWSPHDPMRLATGGGQGDGRLIIWDTSNQRQLRQVQAPCQITDVLWGRHEDEIATAHGFYDNSVVVWQAQTLHRLADLRSHTGRVVALDASPDGAVVASMGGEELCFWQLWKRRERESQLRQNIGKDPVPRGFGYR